MTGPAGATRRVRKVHQTVNVPRGKSPGVVKSGLTYERSTVSCDGSGKITYAKMTPEQVKALEAARKKKEAEAALTKKKEEQQKEGAKK